MPNITVELLRGRSLDQRRAFAQAVADSAVELLGARRQDVRMVFTEITPDAVANGGVLASEDDSRAGVVAALTDEA
jgi:4-oxalocrotonate tautomerase